MQPKKNLLLLAPAALLAMSLNASADMGRLTLDVNSNFRAERPLGDDADTKSSINHIEVIGGLYLTDGVKAVLRAEFEDSDFSDIEIEDAIREAKIQFRLEQMEGSTAQTVRAFITDIEVGVLQAVYGTQVSGNPVGRSTSPTFFTSEGDESVIGLSMSINTSQLALIDEMKMSFYDTGDGDGINMDGENAASLALAKNLGDFRAEFAARWIDGQDEIEAELGLVYDSGEGYKIWGVAHKFADDNDADNGLTIGASYDLPKGSVFLEAFIDDEDETNVVAGYELPSELLPRGMKVTPWIGKNSEEDDAKVGVDVSVSYQSVAQKELEL